LRLATGFDPALDKDALVPILKRLLIKEEDRRLTPAELAMILATPMDVRLEPTRGPPYPGEVGQTFPEARLALEKLAQKWLEAGVKASPDMLTPSQREIANELGFEPREVAKAIDVILRSRTILLERGHRLRNDKAILARLYGRTSQSAGAKPHEIDRNTGKVKTNPKLQVPGRNQDAKDIVDPREFLKLYREIGEKQQGFYIWLIDEAGRLRVAEEAWTGERDPETQYELRYGHPTLTGGTDEARIAGELRLDIDSGKWYINNASGRFSKYPDRGLEQLQEAAKLFEEAGLKVEARWADRIKPGSLDFPDPPPRAVPHTKRFPKNLPWQEHEFSNTKIAFFHRTEHGGSVGLSADFNDGTMHVGMIMTYAVIDKETNQWIPPSQARYEEGRLKIADGKAFTERGVIGGKPILAWELYATMWDHFMEAAKTAKDKKVEEAAKATTAAKAAEAEKIAANAEAAEVAKAKEATKSAEAAEAEARKEPLIRQIRGEFAFDNREAFLQALREGMSPAEALRKAPSFTYWEEEADRLGYVLVIRTDPMDDTTKRLVKWQIDVVPK